MVALLNLKCYMAWLVLKKGLEKNMYFNEIGLCSQNVDTILEEPIRWFKEQENIHFDLL